MLFIQISSICKILFKQIYFNIILILFPKMLTWKFSVELQNSAENIFWAEKILSVKKKGKKGGSQEGGWSQKLQTPNLFFQLPQFSLKLILIACCHFNYMKAYKKFSHQISELDMLNCPLYVNSSFKWQLPNLVVSKIFPHSL